MHLLEISLVKDLFRHIFSVFEDFNCLLTTRNYENFGMIFSLPVSKKYRASTTFLYLKSTFSNFLTSLTKLSPQQFYKTFQIECLTGNSILATNVNTSAITLKLLFRVAKWNSQLFRLKMCWDVKNIKRDYNMVVDDLQRRIQWQ